MLKYFVCSWFLLLAGLCFAQTDSLTIKLEQYKRLFDKGLINESEYEALKAKVLQIDNRPAPAYAADTIPQRKETFSVCLTPVFYYDVKVVAKNTFNSKSYSAPGKGNVGFHILGGPVIKKRFHTHAGVGIEGWSDIMRIPVYTNFGMKMLKTKYSPYYHVSLGYCFIRDRSAGNATGRYNALLTGAGLGFSVYAAKNFVVLLCADYRLLYYGKHITNFLNREDVFLKNFVHQAGLRLQLNCF